MCRVANHQTRLPRATSSLAFNAPRDGASTASLGNLFQCVTTLGVKSYLLISNLNLPCPSLKPFPLVLSLSTLVNSLSTSCLYAPFKYWKATMRSPQILLLSKQNKPSSLSLSSQERCSSPQIISVALLWTRSKSSTSFLYWGLQAWMQYSRWGLTRAE